MIDFLNFYVRFARRHVQFHIRTFRQICRMLRRRAQRLRPESSGSIEIVGITVDDEPGQPALVHIYYILLFLLIIS